MKPTPLVSAIYCNFNHGKYLEQCFEGLLRQNYKNFELLITDDGSTDDSRSIIERYAARASSKSLSQRAYSRPGRPLGAQTA
ncbi:MAG: glycosyltransferase, partial [Opitutus sp.]|nr:glycosyltransferase [Opitutus sp.]